MRVRVWVDFLERFVHQLILSVNDWDLLDEILVIEGFENGNFAHASTGNSFVHVIESTDFEGYDLIGSIVNGLVYWPIGALAYFIKLSVVRFDLH